MSSSIACSAPTPITASRSISSAPTRHRRLVLRLGGGGRGQDVRLRARQRHRRLDPRAGVVLRALWLAADARPHHAGGVTPMAPSYDTVGFLAREAELFRERRPCAARPATGRSRIERLILPRRFLRSCRGQRRPGDVARAHRMAGACRRPSGDRRRRRYRRLAQCLPRDSRLRDPVDLVPFIRSHMSSSAPGIKERFDMAAAIAFAEAEAARRPCAPRSPRGCASWLSPGA